MSYRVEILEEVRDLDIPALKQVHADLAREVVKLVQKLQTDPWIGVEMRDRPRMEILSDCRKIPFDLPGHKGKPRFRLVYRNDPNDGSIAVVQVLSVGPRSELDAYRQAVTRVAKRRRER